MGHVPQWPLHRAGHQGAGRFGAELVPLEHDSAISVDVALGELGVLTEPASVQAKASVRGPRVRGVDS